MTALKILESFEHEFTLPPTAKSTLHQLLESDEMCQVISSQKGCDRVQFTGMLFQPAPYTVNEPKGMPRELEQYHESPDYVIINVPPQFMFDAKIFKPSRLCAIYQVIASPT